MIIQNASSSQPAVHDATTVVANHPKPAVGNAGGQSAPISPSPDKLKGAVDIINQVMRQWNNSLEFSVDGDTKIPIVKLVDTETGDLIRQYPSEETLAISRSIDQYQQQHGLLLKQKA